MSTDRRPSEAPEATRTRQTARRERFADEGGAQFATMLSAEATEALERLVGTYGTKRAAVEAALILAAGGRRKRAPKPR